MILWKQLSNTKENISSLNVDEKWEKQLTKTIISMQIHNKWSSIGEGGGRTYPIDFIQHSLFMILREYTFCSKRHESKIKLSVGITEGGGGEVEVSNLKSSFFLSLLFYNIYPEMFGNVCRPIWDNSIQLCKL